MEPRLDLAVEGLHSRGAVDMGHRRQPLAPFGPHREHPRHEAAEPGAAGRHLEEAIGMLGRHDRREGAEFLAIFDVAVEPVAHRGVVRRGEDAAMAERARAEFESPIHPADDRALRQLGGDLLEQPLVIDLVERQPILAGDAEQRLRIDRRPPIGMVGEVAVGTAELDAVGMERGAERAARVAGRGRHEDPAEAAFAEHAPVGDAVERHPAAEAEIVEAGLALEVARDIDQYLLEHRLRAGGDVGEAAALVFAQVDRLIGSARRAEQLDEARRIAGLGGAVEIEKSEVELEGAVPGAPDQPPDVVGPVGHAIGREAHHLIFPLVNHEAEKGRKGRIEEA